MLLAQNKEKGQKLLYYLNGINSRTKLKYKVHLSKVSLDTGNVKYFNLSFII